MIRERIVDQSILDYYAGDPWMLDLLARARPFNDAAIALPVNKESDEAEWLETRFRTIGASESAAAARYSRWKTAPKLFRHKYLREPYDADKSESERARSEASMRAGNLLEPVIRDTFAADNGVKVERVNSMLLSRRYPFLSANLDGRIVGKGAEKLGKPGDRAGLECKMAGYWAGQSEDWGPSWSDIVPQEYFVQGIQSLIVTGWDAWYYSVFTDAQFRFYAVRADDPNVQRFIPPLLEELETFAGYLRRGEYPPPQAESDADERFKTSRKESRIEVSPEMLDAYYELLNVREDRKKLEAQEADLARDLKWYMGDNEVLMHFDERLIVWKNNKARENFATAKHRDEQPECHAKYASLGAAPRPFVVKGE